MMHGQLSDSSALTCEIEQIGVSGSMSSCLDVSFAVASDLNVAIV